MHGLLLGQYAEHNQHPRNSISLLILPNRQIIYPLLQPASSLKLRKNYPITNALTIRVVGGNKEDLANNGETKGLPRSIPGGR